MEVDLGPGDIVLDGVQLPQSGGDSIPNFGHVLWPNGCMNQGVTCYGVGLGPGHIVLHGDPALIPEMGHSSPNFRPMSVVAKRLDGSRCDWPHCVIWGPTPKGHMSPSRVSLITISARTLNKYGERTQPCRTPFR